jgi:hypothetical protein
MEPGLVQFYFLPAIAIAGFFSGGIVFTQWLRYVALLVVAFSRHGGDFLGPARRRLLWILPIVVLFHPGVYLLIALVVVTGLYLQDRVASGWGWFLAGFYVYIVFAALSVASSYRRIRRHPKRSPPVA